jgi:hypothetical protein
MSAHDRRAINLKQQVQGSDDGGSVVGVVQETNERASETLAFIMVYGSVGVRSGLLQKSRGHAEQVPKGYY